MAEKRKKEQEPDASALGRLSKAGEDALTRLVDELGKNERLTDALGRAMSAKGKLDDGAKRALGSVGLAAADELKDLRTHIQRLEKRLAKLESQSKSKSPAKPKSRAKPAAEPTTTERAKETAEQSSSPAPGRSIGGGTGRGSGAGGTAAS